MMVSVSCRHEIGTDMTGRSRASRRHRLVLSSVCGVKAEARTSVHFEVYDAQALRDLRQRSAAQLDSVRD